MDGRQGWRPAPVALRGTPHLVLVGACAGLVAGLYWAPAPLLTLLGVAASAVAGGVVVARGRAGVAVSALALAALLAGLAWGGVQVARTAPPSIPLPSTASGTVALDAPAVPQPEGWRVRAIAWDLRLGDLRRVPRGTRLLVEFEARTRPRAGRIMAVQGRLAAAAGTDAPKWWRRYLERQGIAARLAVRDARDLRWRGGLAGLRERWRGWARSAVADRMGGDRGALVRGMALGGGSELSQDTADAFRTSGLWHLLAVSGQNVTVVAVAMLLALRGLGAPRRSAVVGAGLALGAYCLAADGGASVGRACAVGALGLVAELRPAPRERWYLLLVGLAALLAAQPRSAHDPGLQLSFAAVAGLTALAPRIEGGFSGWLPAPLARLAAAAGAAGVATAPVLAWHFGRISLAGLVANVIAVPLAAPIVVLALLGAAIGALQPDAGVVVSALAGFGADMMLVVARIAAAPPGASVAVPRELAPGLVGLGALLAILSRVAGGRWALHRVLRQRPRLGVGATSAALAVLVLFAGRQSTPQPWPDGPEIVVLDVGQGQAVLLRDGAGAAALVDAGPPGSPAPVVGALQRLGVRRLTALAITHPALDHAGGVRDLLDTVEVGRVLVPPFPKGPPHVPTANALAAAHERGVAVTGVRAGDAIGIGEWRFRVLWPRARIPAGIDPNRGSLVLVAKAAGWSALLPGDAESPTLGSLSLGSVDVLVVGHHGSADPGLTRLLERLRPRSALISVGAGNRFGHPVDSTLDALRDASSAVFRTDEDGHLAAQRAGMGVAVATSR